MFAVKLREAVVVGCVGLEYEIKVGVNSRLRFVGHKLSWIWS